MKSCLLLTIVFFVWVSFVTAIQNCGDCFCPCRFPGSNIDSTDWIYPSDECLQKIRCEFGKDECSAEVMDCQEPQPQPTELCFCPCRIPNCDPVVLYYPGQQCLQKIKCRFGESECSSAHIHGSV